MAASADVVSAAGPGKLAAFSGPDDAEKVAGAASVARALGKPLLEVRLGDVVSAYLSGCLAKLFRPAAERRRLVLVVTDADSLFGVRPEALDIRDPYADVNVAEVLELTERRGG